jgi:hypothetical protein
MVDQRHADYLKWSVAIFVGLINISVFIIWIPAQLQISQRWIDINTYWDRCEKVLFAVLDISLNIYFVYLVRSKLIANGLEKYRKLFRFNLAMIFVSVSLDVSCLAYTSYSYANNSPPDNPDWDDVSLLQPCVHTIPPHGVPPEAAYRDEPGRTHCEDSKGI